MRTFARLLGPLVLLAPVTALALWGGVYLWACYHAISGEGSALSYTLQTNGGPLLLRVDRWSFNAEQGNAGAQGLSVRQADGTLLLSSRTASVTGLKLSELTHAMPIQVSANGVFVQIERNRRGEWVFLKYLPKPKEPTAPRGVRVAIRNLVAKVVDNAGREPFRKTVTSDVVRVDSFGDRWLASGSIDGLGNAVPVRASGSPSGILLQTKVDQLDLAPYQRHLGTAPEGRDLPLLHEVSVARSLVSGPVEVWIPANGAVRFEGTLEAEATGFAYGETKAGNVRFKGLVTEAGATGEARAVEGKVQGAFAGSVRWDDEFRLSGKLTASASRVADLPAWARKEIPKPLEFNGGMVTGALAYDKQGLSLRGKAFLGSIRWAKEQISDLAATLDIDGSRARVQIDRARWMRSPVSGALAYGVKDKSLNGWAKLASADLAPLAQRFGANWVRANGDATVLIQGTSDKPEATLDAEGTAEVKTADRQVELGDFSVRGILQDDRLVVRRFAVRGEQGDLSAEGVWDLKKDEIRGVFFGGGFPLAALSKELEGSAILAGFLTGSSKDMKGYGKLEIYSARLYDQDIPFLQSDLTVDSKGFAATGIQAVRGAARLNGEVALKFKGRELIGQLSGRGVQLKDILGEDYAGSLSLDRAAIRGTLDSPVIEGTLRGERLVAKGVVFDQAFARGVIDGTVARVDEFNLGDGRLTASGSFNLESKQGVFAGEASALALRPFAEAVTEDARLSGFLSGEFSLQTDGTHVRRLSGKGSLDQIRANAVDVGSGSWQVDSDGSLWTGNMMLGDLDSFIEVSNAEYHEADGHVRGVASILGFPISDLVAASRRYVAASSDAESKAPIKMPAELLAKFESLTGSLDASAEVSGAFDDPTVEVKTLTASNLKLGDDVAGTIDASGRRERREWTLDHLAWTGGPGDLRVAGTVAEHGDTNLEGEFRKLDPKWLAIFEPKFAQALGTGEVLFSVSGATEEPEIRASLAYRSGVGSVESDPRRFDLLATVKQGSISADGSYFFDGFTGSITANLPFRYPFEIPRNEPVSAEVLLPRRDLKELSQYIPSLDPQRSEGLIAGKVKVDGDLDHLSAKGEVTLDAKSIAAKNFATKLDSVTASAGFDGQKVSLDARGDSSEGGNFEVQKVSLTLADLEDLLNDPVRAFLDAPVGGSVKLNELRVKQNNPKNDPFGFTLDGKFGGSVDLSGPLRNVRIASGSPLKAEGLFLKLPSEYRDKEPGPAPLVNPSFDLRALVADRARLDAGTGIFEFTGDATVGGNLQAPDVLSRLSVERGSIALPNSKITLDPGGEITVTYRANSLGDSIARADVNLTGRTALTARGPGGDVERYAIELGIRGDLLQEGGLALTARSSPPGLSQDQILGLIGQGDILTGGAGENKFNLQRRLQDALTQIALPALIDSYTSRVATKLGLDYFAFEYNPFENLSVTVAKSIGSNFTLQFRRQLSEPVNGLPSRYDLRLFYRPAFRRNLPGRFSFSVGTDQDRPWKISVEYGFKF